MIRGALGACLPLLAACGWSEPARLPPPPPAPVVILETAPSTTTSPRVAAAPDPVTGRPPGWYVPDPPPAPEPPPPGTLPEAPRPAVAVAPVPVAPVPEAPSAVAADPELRARALLRQFPWVSRFWSELGGAERGRVQRAFLRRGEASGFEAAWDRMGLQDRVVLLFGPGRSGA